MILYGHERAGLTLDTDLKATPELNPNCDHERVRSRPSKLLGK